MTSDRIIYHEDNIAAAFEDAELILRGLVARKVVVIEGGDPMLREVARLVATAVIRSAAADEDITTLPGVSYRQVTFGKQ